MIKEIIGAPEGFRVMHEFGGWRIAYHAYKEEVNSIQSLKKWGVHVDSDEAFILISGEMLLATAGTLDHAQPATVECVEPGNMYVVEQGERHAIVLKENAVVLIVENRDMSNFIETDIEASNMEKINHIYTECFRMEEK